MTTFANMKHIACLLCIAVLLAGCAGIAKMLFRPGNGTYTKCFYLEVDGQLYYCGLSNRYEDSKYVHAVLQAVLLSEEYARKYLAESTTVTEKLQLEETLMGNFSLSLDFGGWSPIEVKPNYFRIIEYESKTILFEMPLVELGVSVVQRDRKFCEEKLKEAMTRVIRENVKP